MRHIEIQYRLVVNKSLSFLILILILSFLISKKSAANVLIQVFANVLIQVLANVLIQVCVSFCQYSWIVIIKSFSILIFIWFSKKFLMAWFNGIDEMKIVLPDYIKTWVVTTLTRFCCDISARLN